jgi:hypothetical protein
VNSVRKLIPPSQPKIVSTEKNPEQAPEDLPKSGYSSKLIALEKFISRIHEKGPDDKRMAFCEISIKQDVFAYGLCMYTGRRNIEVRLPSLMGTGLSPCACLRFFRRTHSSLQSIARRNLT